MEYNSFTGTFSGSSTGTEVSISGEEIAITGQRAAEFNAAHGFETPGDILSTVKAPSGSAVVGREVRPSDTIQVHGHRMTLAMAQQLGFITKDSAGNFAATAAGQAGATHRAPEGAATALASGGTAEEGAEGTFLGTPEAEEALAALTASVSADTQLVALDSLIRNGGEVEPHVLRRMASQASVEPEAMAAAVEVAREGMETAVFNHLEPLGVYDREAFAAFVHSSPETFGRMVSSVRDLMLTNSTKGLEGLAEEFAERADEVDPRSVAAALAEAGIPFTRSASGLVVNLSKIGAGQMPFRQAVRLGFLKLSRNR